MLVLKTLCAGSVLAKALSLTLSNRKKQTVSKEKHIVPVEMVMKKGTLNKDHVAQTCVIADDCNNQNHYCFDITGSSCLSSVQDPTLWIAVYGTVNDKICFVICEGLAKATNKKLVLHSFLLNSSRCFQRNTKEYHNIPLLPVLQ